jgi:hypothetical protein
LDVTVDGAATTGERGSPRRKSALLPTRFVRDLMAAGQADILIGVPTLNHAQTVGQVARTIHELFTTVYGRQRTVLVNPDGGSTDGSQAAVVGSGAPAADLVVTSFNLRTLHRISTPYHGVPGRGSAIRLIFAAADLLNVRAVAVIGPESTELTVDDMARLLSPVLESGIGYVKPVRPRAPEDGPLVTQLVRPLLGAVFGARLLEPIDPLLACSRDFARCALQREIWDTRFTQYGLDPWLGAIAVLDGFELAQAHVHAQHAGTHGAPPFSEVFQQVVGSTFSLVTHEHERWRSIAQGREVPVFGEPVAGAAEGARFEEPACARALRDGVDALQPLLGEVLRADTLAALRAAANRTRPGVDAELWVRTVYEFLAGEARGTLPPEQLVQALQPIYLGRLAGLLAELAGTPPQRRAESLDLLAQTFQRLKPELAAAWPSSRGSQR